MRGSPALHRIGAKELVHNPRELAVFSAYQLSTFGICPNHLCSALVMRQLAQCAMQIALLPSIRCSERSLNTVRMNGSQTSL